MNPFRWFATAPGRPAPRLRPEAVPLDDRVAPAVGALGLVEGNFVTVVGDGTDTTIVVRQFGGQLALDGGRFVTAAGPTDSIPAAAIDSLLVLAGAGNDQVLIDGSVSVPAVIEGGDGDDVLAAGGGPTELFGGAGADALDLGAGNGVADAGAGADSVAGGAGRDRVADAAAEDSAADVELLDVMVDGPSRRPGHSRPGGRR